MSSYTLLAPVAVTAAADATGLNTGNLTSAFTSSYLPVINTYEVYHMTVTSAPVLASASILLRNKVYSTVVADISGKNEYDPNQPPILNAGDELYFLWNIAASSATIPVVTIWPRYDTELPQNVYPRG